MFSVQMATSGVAYLIYQQGFPIAQIIATYIILSGRSVFVVRVI
jgi:hypothetical protein